MRAASAGVTAALSIICGFGVVSVAMILVNSVIVRSLLGITE